MTTLINEDIKNAMRNKEVIKLSTLRMLKSAIQTAAKEKQVDELAEADVISIIRKELKKRKETLDAITDKTSELAIREEVEKVILEAYLPVELSSAELVTIVQDAIKEASATTKRDMGKVMKLATTKVNGRTDGATISKLVQSYLP